MKKTSILLVVLFVFISNAALSQVTNYSFTASTGIYAPVTGVSPDLAGDGTDSLRDEGYANNIPLGFTFNYIGTNYTTISASTNGFAAFGAITTPEFSNHIATGSTGRPLLAPFWEDITLASKTDLKYTTTGAAGSRVFVLQWDNVFFDFGANDTSLSFQLRLYETTNVIEFVYNQLPGPVQDFSGGASIGITAAATGSGSFLSLNNSSASPAVSSDIATDTIKTRPATGQVYTFTPPACMAPGGLAVTNITTTDAMIAWADAGSTLYEYAVTSLISPPASGTATAGISFSVAGLLPGTQYYLHVRKDCAGSFSGWNGLGFVTASDTATIPYTMPISNVTAPALPVCVTVKDENADGNTWRSYPSGGQGWTDQVLAYVYNINGTTPANDWLFTKALNLTAGTNYRLKFKYGNDLTSLYPEKLKVAYGDTTISAAMTNILANYTTVSGTAPKTALIDFTPASSRVYYIGFQAYSDANKDVLILDDISVDLRPSCDMPDTLAANVASAGTSATVSWTPPSFGTPSGYEYSVITSATPPVSGTATASLSVVVDGLIAYTQYYLHVRTNCGGGAFSAWTTFPFATVGNDEPCNAITLTAGGAPSCGNNVLATAVSDPNSLCSSPDHTVWYKYTATANGTVVLHITTPAAPANPLHGWVGWYLRSSACPNISLYQYGSCVEFGKNGNNNVDELISPSLINGTTYYIMIDGYSDDVGEFCISIPACSPALGVQVSNILSTSAKVTWTGSGSYILEYGPAGFTPGTDATAGASGIVITSVTSPYTLTGLALFTTYDVYLRKNCSSSGQGYSNNSTVATFTTSGQPPPNDDCSGAIALTISDTTCGGATTGTTLYATKSSTTPVPSCGDEPGAYDDDVWYSFTPSAGQLYVNIDFTYVSGYPDVTAQVYTSSNNTCSGTFSLLSCNDDGGPDNMPGFTSLQVTPGTTYFIRVFSDTLAVNSQFTICVTKGYPKNDNAAGAFAINVDAGCSGAIYTNAGSTQSAGEPSGTCSSTKGYATVWYKFTAPAGGAVKISTAAGSGNTLTDTRVALFAASNANDYSTFSIVACDEDGGSGTFGSMSVLYAAGLTVDNVYYIEVDKFDSAAAAGTFCLTVEKLRDTMLATTNNCNSVYQIPVGSIANYKGWVSLMDENNKLIALVKNPAGSPVNAYTAVQNVSTGAVRQDITSGDYYLNRSYTINNTASPGATLNAQFFFLTSELAALTAVDPAASLTRLRLTTQTASTCQPDFVTANGVNTEVSQTGSGASSGVSWITANISGYTNYYIHAVKSYLTAKVFLQGAYDANLGRHKDVTPAWANVLNTYAKNQPYNNNAAAADTAHEGFGASTPGGTGKPVYHVTNLNASGNGSLFSVMGSNRSIVFDVGGTINNFSWYGSGIVNLTIDGSTAPLPGITLNNNNNGDCLSFDYGSHDIIVKNIRVRNAGNDGINVLNNSYNILFDHISVSGSGDGDLDITDGAYNITVQWSILGAGKQFWSGAMLIAYPGTKDISLHHNLYTTSGSGTGERNPFVHNATNYVPNPITYLMSDFTNNIVWKWGNSDGTSGYGSGADYGGTLQARNNFYQSPNYPSNAIVVNPNSTDAKAYASGNVSGNSGINPNAASNVASPWIVAPVTTQDVCTATALVLDRAGPRPLDETDQAFINSVSVANCQGFQNQAPVANGGQNITLALPTNSTTLSGSGIDADGTIASYAWTRVSGPTTYTLGTANAASTTLSNLVAGTYVFRLTVKDNDGATTTDNVRVTVVNTGINQPPTANAGNTIILILPENSTSLNGSAADADGTIASYLWSRTSGPATYTLGNTNATTATVSDLVQGTYFFRLTVTDNNGATGLDSVKVIVNPATAANTATYGSYAGSESVANGFFTSTPATTDIVDWVMLEFKNYSGSIVSRRAAFVREDGNIVDLDGVSPVSLQGLPSGNYYLTIRHRNHLSVRTSLPQNFADRALGVSSSLGSYDFTTAQNKAYQNPAITTNAAMAQSGSVYMMWAGNASQDEYVRVTSQAIPPIASDASYILGTILAGNPNGTVTGYSVGDCNMDGNVRSTSQAIPFIQSDIAFILGTVLGGNSNATRREHK